MNSLDKLIKSERKRKYKRLIKTRKARDVASKYSEYKLLLSQVYKIVNFDKADEYLFISNLAKYILDKQILIANVRPPKPPSQM